MSHHLQWFAGKYLTGITIEDFTWSFRLGKDSWISTESFWRLLTPENIAVTSEDHGHQFGLPKPVDATERVTSVTKGRVIERYQVVEVSSDLILFFEAGAQLQFLNHSSGYESWRASSETVKVICQGGGKLAVFDI